MIYFVQFTTVVRVPVCDFVEAHRYGLMILRVPGTTAHNKGGIQQASDVEKFCVSVVVYE